MIYRITYRMEIFIDAKNPKEIRDKWDEGKHTKPEFCEVSSVEDEDYNEVDMD